MDLFHGGAKAGIIGDPHAPDKEAVLRAFARALANEVPAEYVFGLDMGLTEHDAAIFVDSSVTAAQPSDSRVRSVVCPTTSSA